MVAHKTAGLLRMTDKKQTATGRMMRVLVLCGLALLIGCQKAGMPEAPTRADLSADLLRTKPTDDSGTCWARDVTPAVIETVTEQVEAVPASLGEDGVARPAVYHSVTQQHIVKDREEVWFATPCPADMTVDFVATVQRALKARGFYMLPLTGEMDAPTRDAIRRFQEPLGLDSPVLSLGAARDLGIVTTDLDRL